MNLNYNAEYETFRTQVKHFLALNWPLQGEEAALKRSAGSALFRGRAIKAGYLYRSVPKAYGGAEQAVDVLRAQIIRDEFARVKAPTEVPGVGTTMLVPTLLEYGTEAQKAFFIAKTLSGEFLWAQGYSEPNAGSDLASLKTTARLVPAAAGGQEWRINGQKIWSTLAQFARFMFVLARTESTEAGKHAGISYLLVDLQQPGITVRPLKQITGSEEFCEVFFDDAVTPADWIVGERGQGWKVSKATLSHERSALGGASTSVDLFNKVVELARRTQRDGKPAIASTDIRLRLAALEAVVESHLYSGYRQLSMGTHGQDPGVVTLMNKLISTNIGHDVAKLARDLIGDDLLIAPGQAKTRDAGNEKWINQFMGSLGIAIAGGTSNIQRNVIADRGFGLPRDAAAQA